MKNIRSCFVLLAASLLSLQPARAAFDPAIVSSDARWVVYADLDAVRASGVGKQLLPFVEKAQRESNSSPLGIDIQKVFATIGRVTAYGANFTNDPAALDGALIVQGTADLRKIAEAALVQATITTPERVKDVTGLPYPVYAIYPNKPAPAAGADAKATADLQVFVAFPPEPFVLVSKSQAQLVKTREIVLGHQPSLAQTPGSPLSDLVSNAHNAYLFAASVVPSDTTDINFPADAPQSRILQMTRAGSLSLGENGPMTFAHVELLASSDAMADKLMKILQGMTAMVSLTESSDKDLTDFLNSATVARNDQTVTLHLAYSSARIADMIQNFQKGPATSGVAGTQHGRPLRQDFGTVLSEWKIVQQAAKPDTPPPADTVAWQTVENVHLQNDSLLTISARTNGRVAREKTASFDRIEITPSQGGAPLTFRAEYLKIVGGFLVDRAPSPLTKAKLLIEVTPVAYAQLQFPGGDGTYTVRVAYINNGLGDNTTLGLSVKDPAPPAPEAKPNADAGK